MSFLGLGSLGELMDKKKHYATVAVSAVLIPAAIWWAAWSVPAPDYLRISPSRGDSISRDQTG